MNRREWRFGACRACRRAEVTKKVWEGGERAADGGLPGRAERSGSWAAPVAGRGGQAWGVGSRGACGELRWWKWSWPRAQLGSARSCPLTFSELPGPGGGRGSGGAERWASGALLAARGEGSRRARWSLVLSCRLGSQEGNGEPRMASRSQASSMTASFCCLGAGREGRYLERTCPCGCGCCPAGAAQRVLCRAERLGDRRSLWSEKGSDGCGAASGCSPFPSSLYRCELTLILYQN